MRCYLVEDEVAEWIDKWATQPKAGGFQHKCKEISDSELDLTKEPHGALWKVSRLTGIRSSIECLQALEVATEEDE